MTTTTPRDLGGHDDRLQDAERVLARRIGGASRQLNERLETVRSARDLSWRALLASQRSIEELDGLDQAPNAREFWANVAHPLSRRLTDDSFEVIEDEFDRITAGIARFRVVADELLEPAEVRQRVRAAVAPLLHVGLDPAPLNDIGARWHRRLRRTAIRGQLTTIVMRPAKEIDLHVSRRELELLESAPWLHGDRMLAAFETAHADVRAALRQAITDAIHTRADHPVRPTGSHAPGTTSVIVPDWSRRQLLRSN